jgi:hypothetical protein
MGPQATHFNVLGIFGVALYGAAGNTYIMPCIYGIDIRQATGFVNDS